MRRSTVALVVLALAGCASVAPTASYVSDVSPADATPLASALAAYLGQQLPPATTTLVLQPPPPSQADNALTPALRGALSHAGFEVFEPSKDAPPPAGAHPIRYQVTPLEGGVLVRLHYDRTEAARWFARNRRGQLQAAGPFTVSAAP